MVVLGLGVVHAVLEGVDGEVRVDALLLLHKIVGIEQHIGLCFCRLETCIFVVVEIALLTVSTLFAKLNSGKVVRKGFVELGGIKDGIVFDWISGNVSEPDSSVECGRSCSVLPGILLVLVVEEDRSLELGVEQLLLLEDDLVVFLYFQGFFLRDVGIFVGDDGGFVAGIAWGFFFFLFD